MLSLALDEKRGGFTPVAFAVRARRIRLTGTTNEVAWSSLSFADRLRSTG
jgi:hypothetical protein